MHISRTPAQLNYSSLQFVQGRFNTRRNFQIKAVSFISFRTPAKYAQYFITHLFSAKGRFDPIFLTPFTLTGPMEAVGQGGHLPTPYSQVSNTRGGSNKRVYRLEFFIKFNKRGGSNNSGQGGNFFICVGEKTGRLEIFLKINKRGGSNNSGQGGKFPEN